MRLYYLIAAVFCAMNSHTLALSTNDRAQLESKWEDVVNALDANAPTDAVELLDEWISRSRALGIRSAEAHYNLGLAHWGAKRPGRSVYHLLESASLATSPWVMMRTISTLNEIERELGLRDGLSQSLAFSMIFLIDGDTRIALSCLAFWCLALSVFLRWRGFLARPRLRGNLQVVSIVLVLIAAVGALNEHYVGSIGVLDANAESVSLYRTSVGNDDNKVVDLPSGAIVTVGERRGTVSQIIRPVLGWVSTDSLLMLVGK